MRPWNTIDQRGQAEARNTSKQAVVHRSVTMSRTVPNCVDCSKYRAAYPSRASKMQDMLYKSEQVRGWSGM